MLVPLLLLVGIVFGAQYTLVKKNEQETREAEKTKSNEGAQSHPVTPAPDVLSFLAKTPRETASAAIDSLKQSQDPRSVLDYVWWPAAYQLLTNTQKTNFDIHSPESLYQYYAQALVSSSVDFYRQLSRDIEKFPEAQRAKTLKFLEDQRKSQGKSAPYTELNDKLLEISEVRSKDGNAELKLSITSKEGSSAQSLKLVEVDGKWAFACVPIVNDPLGLCTAIK